MKKHFEKIKSEGTCIHRLDEELIRRRREELRSVHSLLCLLFAFPIRPSLLFPQLVLTGPPAPAPGSFYSPLVLKFPKQDPVFLVV